MCVCACALRRHYVNGLVKKMIGQDMVTVQLLRSTFENRQRREKAAWLRSLFGSVPHLIDIDSSSASGGGSTAAGDNATAAAGAARRLPIHSMSAIDLSSLPNDNPATDTNPPTTATPTTPYHCATAAATLSHSFAAAGAVAGSGVSAAPVYHPAAPVLVPLLTALPTWDAPIVLLGQLLTHPHHWTAVSTTSQAVALSATVAVGARAAMAAAGLAHAALGPVGAQPAAAAAASALRSFPALAGAAKQATVAAAAPMGPLRQALTALPRLVQSFRTHQLQHAGASYSAVASKSAVHAGSAVMGRTVGQVAGRIGQALAPAAREVWTRASQAAAPLVAVAHSHRSSRQRNELRVRGQEDAAVTVADGRGSSTRTSPPRPARGSVTGSATTNTHTNNPLQLVIRGGLLPLPPRTAAAAPAAAALCASAAAGKDAPAAAVTAVSKEVVTTTVPVRRGVWFFGRRPAVTAKKPSLLPAAALHAAVQPEGPSRAMTARRSFLGLGRQLQRQPSVLQLAAAGAAAAPVSKQARGLFRIACNPLAWITSVTVRRAAAQQTGGPTALVVLPAAVAQLTAAAPRLAAADMASSAMIPLTLSPPRLLTWHESEPQASTDTATALAIQPLDTYTGRWQIVEECTSSSGVTPAVASTAPGPFKLSVRLGRAGGAAAHSGAPASTTQQLDSSGVTAGVAGKGQLLHMPSLPAQPAQPRRLFRARERGIKDGPSGSTEVGRKVSSGPLWSGRRSAWLLALLAHVQASRTSLFA